MHCSHMRLFSLQAIALAVGLFAAPFADAQSYRQASAANGASQDTAADRAGVPRAEFRKVAKRDRGLKIDAGNNAIYICEGAVPASVGTDNSAYTGSAPFPLDQTFKLHSRPGAKFVIYLDFDGHTTSGTITYTVTNVTLSGYTYTPTANKVTSASLAR